MLLETSSGWEALNNGVVIAIVGYVVVFAALVTLYLVFHNLSKLLNRNIRKKLHKEGKSSIAEQDIDIPGDVNAAIGLALYLYFLHDEESDIITIKKISRSYSPWSSKIYGLRNILK